LALAKACREVEQKTKVKIIPVVTPFDLGRIKKQVGGEVWLQHLDVHFEGKKTGWISPLQAIALGADGALLNHSEHKISPGQARQTLGQLKRESWQKRWGKDFGSLDAFKLMVCFRSRGQAQKWVGRLRPRPDYVAYEPPELIGGKVSVSQARPKAIKSVVELLPGFSIIVGAGIHESKDVRVALKLGAKGVLVSSSVVKAKNPEKELLELAKAFKVKK